MALNRHLVTASSSAIRPPSMQRPQCAGSRFLDLLAFSSAFLTFQYIVGRCITARGRTRCRGFALCAATIAPPNAIHVRPAGENHSASRPVAFGARLDLLACSPINAPARRQLCGGADEDARASAETAAAWTTTPHSRWRRRRPGKACARHFLIVAVTGRQLRRHRKPRSCGLEAQRCSGSTAAGNTTSRLGAASIWRWKIAGGAIADRCHQQLAPAPVTHKDDAMRMVNRRVSRRGPAACKFAVVCRRHSIPPPELSPKRRCVFSPARVMLTECPGAIRRQMPLWAGSGRRRQPICRRRFYGPQYADTQITCHDAATGPRKTRHRLTWELCPPITTASL